MVDILVKPREKVKEGDPLVILSSMKMENTIYASENGVVEEVLPKTEKVKQVHILKPSQLNYFEENSTQSLDQT